MNSSKEKPGYIVGADIGIGGYRDAQIGVWVDVELIEDSSQRFRFFDGCWLAAAHGRLDPLQLRQYSAIVTRLHSMLENSGSESLMDLVGTPVEVRIAGNEAVEFRFSEPLEHFSPER